VADGVVYVGSNDWNVYALDALTGSKLWSYPTGYRVVSSPAVANGVVYVGSEDWYVYALNARTGVLLWRYSTKNPVGGSPVVANAMVYIGSGDFYLYAFGQGSSRPAKPEATSNRPKLKTLRPDFNLKVSCWSQHHHGTEL
jgi:outer membrane protein assembly factor BamB